MLDTHKAFIAAKERELTSILVADIRKGGTLIRREEAGAGTFWEVYAFNSCEYRVHEQTPDTRRQFAIKGSFDPFCDEPTPKHPRPAPVIPSTPLTRGTLRASYWELTSEEVGY